MLPVITLTPNPAVDISAAATSIAPTEKVRCHAARRDPGGGGINVARVITRLGGNVTAIFPAGGSCGSELVSLLAQEHVTTRPLKIAGQTREDFAILDETARQQYRFVLPGPALSQPEWRQCVTAIENAGPGGLCCASGSLPPGVPSDFYARVAEAADRAGQRTFLDTAGDALREAIGAPLYLIKPNLNELGGLLGTELSTEGSQLAACRSLLERSRIQAIALTLGAQGAILVTRQMALRAKSASINPLSAVGAGDSFMGALIWAIAGQMDLPEALQYATASGMAAVLTEGTELCRAADVHRLCREVSITDLSACCVG